MVYQIIFQFEPTPFSDKLKVYGDLAIKKFEEEKRHEEFEKPEYPREFTDNDRRDYEKNGRNVTLQWLNDNMELQGFDLVMLTDKYAIFRLRSWWENFKVWVGIRT